MISAGSTTAPSGSATSSSMPVAVIPPGSRRFTRIGVSARSAAMMRESASAPALEGP